MIAACKDGAKVVDLCRLGDETITKCAHELDAPVRQASARTQTHTQCAQT